jgi:hypothetical protein
MKSRRSCGDGGHGYVSAGEVGGGILRFRCSNCGGITIDLREDLKGADDDAGSREPDRELVEATVRLFAPRDKANLFNLWASEARAESVMATSFGRSSSHRRR